MCTRARLLLSKEQQYHSGKADWLFLQLYFASTVIMNNRPSFHRRQAT